MMNTATNNEFYERQSIEEFLVEHEVVRALYVVAQRGFVRSMNRTRQLLEIFNVAYFVCMRLTDGSGRTFDEALNECPYAWREMDSRAYRNHLFALIYSLLRVHQGLLPIRAVDMDCSRNRVDYYFSWSRYEEVISKYVGKLTRPLNFSGLIAWASESPSATEPEAKPDESDLLQLVVRATSDLVKAHGLMKEQLAAKDKRIEELENALRLEQEKGKAELRKKDARIKELEDAAKEGSARLAAREDWIKRLEIQLQQKRLRSDSEVVPVNSTNTINKAINVHTIGKYACEHCKDDPTDVVSTVLRALAMKALLACEEMKEINRVLDEIECARRLSHAAIYNYNKDSQVFNGSITDSKFGK